MPVGLRSRVPAKMTSRMFDLPQPFGPTIAAMPSPWNFSSVRSQNDLNPRICSFFSLSNLYSFLRATLHPVQRPGPSVKPARHSEVAPCLPSHQSNFTFENPRG